MASGGFLVDWSSGSLDALGVELLRLPDEILQEIAVVLGEHQIFRLFDDFSDIVNELLAFGGEPRRRIGERPGREEAVQGHVDLVVL